MRQTRRLRKALSQMLLTAVFLAMAGAGSLTYAQCPMNSSLADESTPGTLRAHGSSTQNGCGVATYVLTWIEIPSFLCSGSTEGGRCYGESDGSNAGSTAFQSDYLSGSTARANSWHWAYQGATRIGLPDRSTTLLVPGESGGGGGGGGGCIPDDGDGIVESGECTGDSPIVIATGKNSAYKMTSAEDGVLFDIDGDGALEKISWTEPGSDVAFLAIDFNGDGQINNGKELIGNHTRPDADNGFSALINMAKEIGITDATLNSNDPLFATLLLWTDSNHNGVSDVDEIRPASEVLSDIALLGRKHNRKDGHGNEYRYQGFVYVRTARGRNRPPSKEEQDGRRRLIYDVYFVRAQ